MKTKNALLPDSSILSKATHTYDYVDSYKGFLPNTNRTYTSTEIGKAFFSSGPKWIDYLFSLRNRIVKLFGLKTSDGITDRQKQLTEFKCEPGEQMGLFKVIDKTENEVIIGEDDKHLNFKVSLLYQQKTDVTSNDMLTITTVVKFNNWFGRLYFLPVRPFHKLIVPAMLKGIIQNLAKLD